MGAALSKNRKYHKCRLGMSFETAQHHVTVNVVLDEERFESIEGALTNKEIQFRVNSDECVKIFYDDIISVSMPIKNELLLISYPIINGKRSPISLKVCFNNDSASDEWLIFLKNATKVPLAPHIPKSNFRRKRRRILVIVNPFGGQQKAWKMWQEIVKPIFIAAQLDYKVIKTECVKHARTIANVVPLDDYDALAVMSGDGLISEVIEGFLLRPDRERALKMPIAHIPGGTSNALAASICFQCNEPFAPRGIFCLEAALMIARPRYLPLRICHVQTEKDGDRSMFLSITWGLVADIDIGSERFRWAGMVRLHMEAIIRIAQLPSVARYKARVSYLPISDEKLKRATRLRHIVDRKLFGEDHFKYDEISNIGEEFKSGVKADDMSEAFRDADLLANRRMPSLGEPVPSDWTVIEGEFVFVCAVNISHLGSDLPYIPSARLDEPILYLTLLDWNTVKSRLQVGCMMITIDGSHHLDYPCLQIIPVRGCRVEPLEGCGGYIAVDGEPITSGTAFQVVPSRYCATVIGRNEVSS